MKNATNRKREDDSKRILLSLPKDYPWKVLTFLVQDCESSLSVDDLCTIRSILRKRDFEAYKGLGGLWGPQSMTLHEGTTKHEHACRYQLSALIKKFRFPSDNALRKQRAIEKFLLTERACKDFNESKYREFAFGETEHRVNVFTYAQQFLVKLLGVCLPEFSTLTEWARHGPGSSSQTSKGRVSSYFKYTEWPYDVTSDAEPFARRLIEDDERWFSALIEDYRVKEGIPMHHVIDMEAFWAAVFNIVEGNRIDFAPKDSLIDRPIAIEPTMNLMLQLGVDGFIRQRLKRWGINLDDQTKNQVLARLGSLPYGLRYATIDLASASDSVCLKLCQLLLPPEWYTYLCNLRSPKGTIGDDLLSYEKISSMGNGYTFALESAIFTSLVYATAKACGHDWNHDDFAVYGDDIIVPQHLALATIESLSIAGFNINLDKSFVFGPFRESCGADWLDGTQLRPVFLTEEPTDLCDLFVDINRLAKRMEELVGDAWQSNCYNGLRTWIPELGTKYVGPPSLTEFSTYLHTPVRPRMRRWQYKFARLITVPLEKKGGKSLHMRKLMHPLRGDSRPVHHRRRHIQESNQLLFGSGSGNRFTITQRNAEIVREMYSHTSNWCDTYDQLMS